MNAQGRERPFVQHIQKIDMDVKRRFFSLLDKENIKGLNYYSDLFRDFHIQDSCVR